FSLRISFTFSLIITFLVDFLAARYFLMSNSQTSDDSSYKKPKREHYWSLGIFPGIVTIVFLTLQTLIDMTELGARATFIAVFAIIDIIASHSGGKAASLTTKQSIETDFELESKES
ncbi:MAG: hypothetical protein ACTSPB_23400, partial [Candidatus Thorarchaeota archaeon]